jgi:crotonobetainyl-CoA:carnitine CoA-transferase CaiB-like acyl-CoA transferase
VSNLLSGVTVVEPASWTYVPGAGVVLRDWGADVIKIEDTRGGDPCRYLTVAGLDPADSRVSANFMMEIGNHGKRSIGMNIKSPVGRDIFAKLIARADIFLTNWLPGQLARRAQRRHDSRVRCVRLHRPGQRRVRADACGRGISVRPGAGTG